MNLQQVAVAACGEHCDEIIHKIETSPAAGFRANALYNLHPGCCIPPRSSVQVFEEQGAFARYVREQQIGEVWLALPLTEERAILKLVAEFRNDLINVRFMMVWRILAH